MDEVPVHPRQLVSENRPLVKVECTVLKLGPVEVLDELELDPDRLCDLETSPL